MPNFLEPISDARWHPRPWPYAHAIARCEVNVVPAQHNHFRGSEAVAFVPVPRAFLLGGLDEPLDLPLGQIFAAASAPSKPTSATAQSCPPCAIRL